MAAIHRSTHFKHQQGLGLVEVMISLTLGLLILAGVLQMYATSSQNARSSEATSRIQENVRYALNIIQNDIKHAGNLGCISFQQDNATAAVGESDLQDIVRVLLTNKTGRYQWDRFVGGDNDTGVNSSDEFTVRFNRPVVRLALTSVSDTSFTVDDTATGYSALRQYQVVTVANCKNSYVFMITNDPTTSGGLIEFEAGIVSPVDEINEGQSNDATLLAKFGLSDIPIVNEYNNKGTPTYLFAGNSSGSFTYYIDDATDAGTTCSAANPEACSLYRDSSNGAPEEMVQGVNDFQVDYGQEVGANLRQANSGGVSDWAGVDRMILSISFNSINEAPTNTGSQLITKTISQTINLANQLD